jgi:RecB family exonuclease
MEQRLQRYLNWEREWGEPEWKPMHFEVAFGNAPREGNDSLSTSRALVLETEAGPVRFAGRVDRIDLRSGAARIIDYKSGGLPKPKQIKDGVFLQLALYAMALDGLLLPDAGSVEAICILVGAKDRIDGLKQDKNAPETPVELARNKIGGYVYGIRAGRFPPVPYEKTCGVCASSRVCRYEPARIERKLEVQP